MGIRPLKAVPGRVADLGKRTSALPGTREGSPKHLFRLHEGFHLALVLRHASDGYVMSLNRL